MAAPPKPVRFALRHSSSTTQHSKHNMHVDGRPKKGCTVSRGELCLMYVTRLSTMTMQLPLAQMANRDGEPGMETMLWDISVIPNEQLTVSMLLPGTSSAAEWRDLLQSRRQFWPTLTTRHASLVSVSAEALQRERRQMQAKHLWYNVDIRWSDLKDKLEVLAPTGLTREDIWRHLFLTKQRKNPYEEGCYTGEDVELSTLPVVSPGAYWLH